LQKLYSWPYYRHRAELSGQGLLVIRKMYVVKHNLITELYLMTVMETTTCFGLYWPPSGCLGNLRARQPDDGQYRPKHVVVSITIIKYTSVIKLCLTTYIS